MGTPAEIGLMSVYQPFPLRISGQQYGACFQIGEFSMPDATGVGTTVVILIPLKTYSSNIGSGGRFIGAFASKIQSAITLNPTGSFPDVEVGGLVNWSISDILKADRPFYTWTNRDGTRVVVMAEPIGISAAHMAMIARLPQTPPGDAIQEIADRVYYKSAAPVDCAGNPRLCRDPFKIVQPPVPSKDTKSQSMFLIGIGGAIAAAIGLLFAMWLAIMFVNGPGAKLVKWIGDKIGGAAVSVSAAAAAPAPAIPAATT